ncbi:MAG: hypothetical protein M1839_008564 [Geoglossum umbratile]|nr:MAG: hypothetical protein M1839_008564 [Geoglossum umbratile]
MGVITSSRRTRDSPSTGEFDENLNFSTWGQISSGESATSTGLINSLSSTFFNSAYDSIALDSDTWRWCTTPAHESAYTSSECWSADLHGDRLANDTTVTGGLWLSGLHEPLSHHGTKFGFAGGVVWPGQNQVPQPFIYQTHISSGDFGEIDQSQRYELAKQGDTESHGVAPSDVAVYRESDVSSSHSARASGALGTTSEVTLAEPGKGLGLGGGPTTGTQTRCDAPQQCREVSSKRAPFYTVLDFRVPHPPATTVASRKQKRLAKSDSGSSHVKRIRSEAPCVRCKMMHEKRGGALFAVHEDFSLDIRMRPRKVCGSSLLFKSRAKMMSKSIKGWYPSEPAKVKVSLGLSRSILLDLSRCEVEDRALLDHTIWRVPDEPITYVATEPVGICGKIPRRQIDAVIDEMIPHALQQLASDPIDAIRSKAFTAAYKKSKTEQDGKLFLTTALRIWAAQPSFFKNYWRVVEGAESVNATYYEPLGAALVPRVLALQLEQMIEIYMKELENEFLHRLENMVFGRDPLLWLSTFLAAFVYLSTLEGDTWDLEKWRAGISVTEIPESHRKLWPRETELSTHIDRNHHQAEMVIAHIKAALGKGRLPFSADSDGELVPTAGTQDGEAYELAAQLAEQFNNYGQYLLFRQGASYSERDRQCLNYMFTSRLLVTDP